MRSRSESECHVGPRGDVLSVAFAGIRFEIEAPSALLAAVSAVPQLCALDRYERENRAPFPATGVSVQLGLRALGARRPSSLRVEALGARDIEWQWHGDTGRAVTLHSCAEWTVVRSKLYAEGAIAPNTRAAESLLTALASAALHHAGGTVLHAASVELPSGVVAFVGPSGAGKSTACRHVVGGKPFSVDRLAIFPARAVSPARALHERALSSARALNERGVWFAAPLPGGTGLAPLSELGSARGKPLALVLHVRHAKEHTTLSECSRIESVTALRASAFHAGTTAATESELLDRLERLSGEVPVLNLSLRLGTPLEPLLCAWLSEESIAQSAAKHSAGYGSQHDSA